MLTSAGTETGAGGGCNPILVLLAAVRVLGPSVTVLGPVVRLQWGVRWGRHTVSVLLHCCLSTELT